MPFKKRNKWFADWRDSRGKRKRKSFRTKGDAARHERKMQSEKTEKKNPRPKRHRHRRGATPQTNRAHAHHRGATPRGNRRRQTAHRKGRRRNVRLLEAPRTLGTHAAPQAPNPSAPAEGSRSDKPRPLPGRSSRSTAAQRPSKKHHRITSGNRPAARQRP